MSTVVDLKMYRVGMLMSAGDCRFLINLVSQRLNTIKAAKNAGDPEPEQYPGEEGQLNNMKGRLVGIAKQFESSAPATMSRV